MIIFVCGMSGSGKDSVCSELLKRNPDIHRMIQYTTRPMRDGEVDGVNYCFISDKEYRKMSSNGKFLETREYFTSAGIWRYSTPKDYDKDLNYLLWGPDFMYSNIRCFDDNVKGILLKVKPIERLNRMLMRGKDDANVIESCRRLYSDEKDFADCNESNYDLIIDNSEISMEECVEKIERYIKGLS